MTEHTLPFDPRLARQVKAESLEPHQHPTSPAFMTACDFHRQHMIKHPFASDFHSYSELLHACLLEGDPTVISYVPQPYRLRVQKKRYTPDCHIVSEGEPQRVVELRPGGKMPEHEKLALVAFFQQFRTVFEVISNESVLEREMEALNWREIVQILHQARQFTTTDAEQQVLERLTQKGPCSLGDIIDDGDRERTYLLEIALFRLLHRGYLRAELHEAPLDYDTEVTR
ncbi:MAG: hypothetical protein N0C84_22835 [Candidatus Thiodiazotropha taylori]|uniref:TnsA endonuclease N-terminal domain-containing protein n=1 Tax=Candidatus Thiodiazotropha taylori TaxID=2792791 RepID=A0A9E4N830_9GAMM|nr:hypothetical protein [Candidatus Thiodiazotropha taylori]MCG7864289.1 hypothetical protein [Candidatus Thiodiazotropha endolucinida]MCG7949179.1 hypothetical protein [Candidatus Thiodiazotropha taylori]MCW4259306.1 hypothetical protein [Candidatus Thiodiazotropha taylori]